ncbi:hypothetical protein MBLNU13_g00395t1 [Cladosporium sp. NU13]
MSRSSSLRHVVSDTPDAALLKAQNQVTLIDHTTPDRISATTSEDGLSDAERAATRVDTNSSEALFPKISRTSLQNSVRHQVNRQKYRRYQQHRYSDGPAPPDDENAPAQQEGQEASPIQRGYLERGKARAKKVLNRKRTLGRGDAEDSVIDILYENQRGAFFFGIPMFSSSSLLNFDPRPWQNAAFRTSASDIRNAQVPDPSWVWDWKSWYVDMSRDVDEEGWEYSFSFQKGVAWHGNHPWFHSFVRRRRWLRKRVRKDTSHKTKERGHELTADYFTIHPKIVRGPSYNSSLAYSAMRARGFQKDDLDDQDVDIADIGTLILILRKSAVDREKLVAVRKFVDQGGDELFYLSERMSDIMSLFIYQSSRRQLLAELIQHFDTSTARKESLSGHMHSDEESKKQHEAAVKQANNLSRAVEAADAQVKRLEYWSDIKSMARHGETAHATDNNHWNPTKWQGLDPASPSHEEEAFRSKQSHTEPAPALHNHAEHGNRRDEQQSTETDASGYATPATSASKVKGLDKVASRTESDGEVYVTAPETPSAEPLNRSFKGKGKGKVRAHGVDGVLEEDSEGEAHAEAVAEEEAQDGDSIFKDAKEVQSIPPDTPLDDKFPRPSSSDGESSSGTITEIVEPKAINADYDESPML